MRNAAGENPKAHYRKIGARPFFQIPSEGGLADPLLRASSEHFLKCAMREHGGLAWPPRLLPIEISAAIPHNQSL